MVAMPCRWMRLALYKAARERGDESVGIDRIMLRRPGAARRRSRRLTGRRHALAQAYAVKRVLRTSPWTH
ncbi:hypothetical protein AZ78_3172 [Lysobacter capsici AZ78]|uniref:Uncharacterized protein n=1 Tax=Lysobacter capsici AZ78 TaxID=1444315 RepID=A0A108UAM3_9GAMM|nr:hypothetical protein AZ78_3172 [Lysobacter capsici AZ78]